MVLSEVDFYYTISSLNTVKANVSGVLKNLNGGNLLNIHHLVNLVIISANNVTIKYEKWVRVAVNGRHSANTNDGICSVARYLSFS